MAMLLMSFGTPSAGESCGDSPDSAPVSAVSGLSGFLRFQIMPVGNRTALLCPKADGIAWESHRRVRFAKSAGFATIQGEQTKWALNSAVECHLHTVEVVGSNPTAPTTPIPGRVVRVRQKVRQGSRDRQAIAIL